jgi:hypothetical protein
MANANQKSTLSFAVSATIDELRYAIPIYAGEITPIILSEPGCGKSSLLAMIAEDMGDKWRKAGDEKREGNDDKYEYIYIDCPLRDVMDMGAYIPVHAEKTLEYYVSGLLNLKSKKPKFIMLDEFMKAPKMMQVLFTRLMLERMWGDAALPKGSCIFGTSNNASDGVGDSMLAHAGNRVMIVSMEKPDSKRWLLWSGEHDIAKAIRAWVAMNPRCLASYLDGGQEDNPYIFKPNNGVLSFVSPRSLAKCDVIVRNQDKVSKNMTRAALAGTIGLSAAEDMAAFLTLEKEIISTKDVIANPETTQIPEKTAALCIMVFNAMDDLVTQDDLSAYMKFVNRIPSGELQNIFFTILMGGKRTFKLGKNNEDVKNWCKKSDNLALLGD